MAYKPYVKTNDGTLAELPLQANVSEKLGTSTIGGSKTPIYLENGNPKQCSETLKSNQEIIDLIYPVGSVYISVNSTSPQTLFGGTWVEFAQGRTIIGKGTSDRTFSAGATGGESSHTLTTSEMPSHYHGLSTCNANTYNDDYDWVSPWGNNKGGGAQSTKVVAEVSVSGLGPQRFLKEYGYNGQCMSSEGGNQSHNNLPPYIVVYMWKRTN